VKVFVGVSYNRDHETQVVGVSLEREGARRLVELARGEMLAFSPSGIDGPEGNVSLDDGRGDMVGCVLAFDVEILPTTDDCDDLVNELKLPKTPTADEVLFEMREEFEQAGGGYLPTTRELADRFNCYPLQMYDHRAATGPLHELLQAGKIVRSEHAAAADPWCWCPTGMRVSWDD